MSRRPRVLVVDDEQSMRELLEIVLGNAGYSVVAASSPETAHAALEAEPFDCLLTDLRMGNDRNAGMDLLSWVQEHSPATPAIMITAHGSVETAIAAMKRGAVDYLMKPFKNDEIRLVVQRAIAERDLRRENEALRRDQVARGSMENMVGASKAVEAVRGMVRRVAALPSTVAIHGESGTGKELVARSIHQLSPRANKPFVAVNCGGIPENLLESELFGHRKGAFTGAVEDREGLFVTADGGTLFLDEIGEMPLALQVKLLRVLDNNIITPVGDARGVKVDVRIISATNRNLEQMTREGGFREDLFYRLNVIPIFLPPLREHPDDVPLLVRHFLRRHAEKMGVPQPELDQDALDALGRYAWPGNVRELQNTLERTLALCDGGRIAVADLPPNIRDFLAPPREGVAELPPGGLELEPYIADIETALIRQAMETGRHSHKKAAELLGLTPRSFRYRLQKYGLDAD